MSTERRWTADDESKLKELKKALKAIGYKPRRETEILGIYFGTYVSDSCTHTLDIEFGKSSLVGLN